jgi:hypothetical protein
MVFEASLALLPAAKIALLAQVVHHAKGGSV